MKLKPSEQIEVHFKQLLMQAATDARMPPEGLPIQVVLAARLEAHERYLDAGYEEKTVRLQ